MMDEPEGSDSVEVAGKPTNKVERSTAEPVEPRTETKGNADQQSTRRAQDRESVSQALERARIAARQRRKEKFTSLLHHVNPAMLRIAFRAMRRRSRRRRGDVGDLRAGPRSSYRRTAHKGLHRGISGAAVPAELYPEGRRQ